MLRAGSLGSCFLHGHPAPLHINAWLSQMASFPSLSVLICKVGNTMSRGLLSGFSEMLNTSGWNRAKTSCQLLFKQMHRCFPGRVKTWSRTAWPQLSLQFLRLSREIPHLQHQCIPALNSATVVLRAHTCTNTRTGGLSALPSECPGAPPMMPWK